MAGQGELKDAPSRGLGYLGDLNLERHSFAGSGPNADSSVRCLASRRQIKFRQNIRLKPRIAPDVNSQFRAFPVAEIGGGTVVDRHREKFELKDGAVGALT